MTTGVRSVAALVAVALLHASLGFESVWPTLGVRPVARVSLEAAALVLLLAVGRGWWAWSPSSRARRWLAIAWVALVAGHYVTITTQALYGRSVNLYWDLKLVPDVGAMFAAVANPLVLAAFVAGLILVPLGLYLPARWAIGAVAEACAVPRLRAALAGLSAVVVAAGVASRVAPATVSPALIAPPISVGIAAEAWQFAREATGVGRQPLPPPQDLTNDLSRIRGADVLLFFVESYGVTSWERPEFRSALAPARATLTDALQGTGRSVVTARVESTTFGGESWLAHISLLSGVEVRDADVNRRLMAERRDTLVTTFTRAGYRAVAFMPGLQAPWPEGGFYGFDRIFGAKDVDYTGPPFGWWDVTDQFVVSRMDEQMIAPTGRPPSFVVFPTISTHAPFMPVPPYQPDWDRLLQLSPYDADALARAYEDVPDWTDLGPGYAKAVGYWHDVLSGYLRRRADRDLVVIMLGDHQPPALVTGEGASWDVPVHVIASRPDVLDRLRAAGFTDGLEPPDAALTRIDLLLPVLLDAFGESE